MQATLGPSSSDLPTLRQMMEAGMDGCRVNMSHCPHDLCARMVEAVREISAEAGRPVAVGADLRGPKLRIGDVAGDLVQMVEGEVIELRSGDGLTTRTRVFVEYPYLAQDVRPGHRVLLNDGMVILHVREMRDGGLLCEVVKGGPLSSRKGLNLPGVPLRVPSLTDKDRRDMAAAVRAGVDFLYLSYARSRQHIAEAREALRRLGAELPLVAKIERQDGVDALPEIVEAADGICIARGDLGIETDLAAVPEIQREAIHLCRKAGKFVMLGGQILASMVSNPIPLRAEVSDLSGAVREGMDAVVLSDETAAGSHPVEAVKVARHIMKRAETSTEPSNGESACTGETVVVVSRNGDAARWLSARRTAHLIVAATDRPSVARWLATWWGVVPVLVADCSDPWVAAREAKTAVGDILETPGLTPPIVLHDMAERQFAEG